jgi:hypothetical protein
MTIGSKKNTLMHAKPCATNNKKNMARAMQQKKQR